MPPANDARPDEWMPMYWAKFFVDTSGFDDAMTGAYASLLGHCWLRGGWLPDDDAQLARFARSTPAKWKRQREVLGRLPYFVVADGRWTQKRLTKELLKATNALKSKIENGRLGGRPCKETKSETKPPGSDSRNRHITEHQTDAEHNIPSSLHPSVSKETSGKIKRAANAAALPDWLPLGPWHDFLQMRKAKAKGTPMSERAKAMAIAKLAELRADGEDPAGILNQSVFHTWSGLFPVAQDRRKAVAGLTAVGARTSTNLAEWAKNGNEGP